MRRATVTECGLQRAKRTCAHCVLCVCKQARGEKVSEKLRCSFSGWLLAGTSARQLGETCRGVRAAELSVRVHIVLCVCRQAGSLCSRPEQRRSARGVPI